ncbi:MAG: Asp-tRNA(Asn)/Glu-tRNA(Gln) amidotransferase subunit GatC [Acidobacteriota bacterium]|nr:Asp-tRNA(Asn)/Glu-tRNA(Gln) amidotransferase subunit GatC [Acidobacteriota bacterium]
MPPESLRDTAARMAALAKLELSEAELDHLAIELPAILGYFDQIAAVDTSAVEPFGAMSSQSALRDDAPGVSLAAVDVFANAPDADRDAGLFRVPRVIGA